MARTESKTFQCHPDAAQGEIDFHQKFHWSLLSSQDVKTVDNRLETLGDTTYSTRTSEHYVKLTFSRELDTPNLNEIKKLEKAYHELREPKRGEYPTLPDTSGGGCLGTLFVIIGLVLCFSMDVGLGITVSITGILLGIAVYQFFAVPKLATYEEEKKRIDQEHKQNLQNFREERRRILSEVEKYG